MMYSVASLVVVCIGGGYIVLGVAQGDSLHLSTQAPPETNCPYCH
jgi:hypothetical protein